MIVSRKTVLNVHCYHSLKSGPQVTRQYCSGYTTWDSCKTSWRSRTLSTAMSMRNRRNIAVNLLKDTFQILNRDLIDGYRCQLRRLSLFDHHYQPTTNLWSPGKNTMMPSWLSCVKIMLFSYIGRIPPTTRPHRWFWQNRMLAVSPMVLGWSGAKQIEGGCTTGNAISHICWWLVSGIKSSEWGWWNGR